MGGREGVTLALRDAIGRGELPGPRMFVCNQPIAVTGGHSSTVTRADLADGFRAVARKQLTVNADGADGFRAAARKQLSVGADFVKVMASHEPWDALDVEPVRAEVSVEEMSAAFNEAREWGKLCAAHATGRKALSRVIEAGVHLVQHGHYLTADIADEMARRGVVLTPTLSCYDVQVMSKRVSGRTVTDQAWGERQRILIDGHASGIAAALKAGVSITVGTDVSGIVSEEVGLLRSHGMSAVDSLLACSLNAARAIRMEDELGTVQAGKRADLVVLGSDPLLSPSALDDVRLVVKDGRLYDPRALLVNILPAPD
jgi:imidazolonepropionase-like amidohydrolase